MLGFGATRHGPDGLGWRNQASAAVETRIGAQHHHTGTRGDERALPLEFFCGKPCGPTKLECHDVELARNPSTFLPRDQKCAPHVCPPRLSVVLAVSG